MNDKEELKEDFVEEKSDGGKLVNRAPPDFGTTIVNNSNSIVYCTYNEAGTFKILDEPINAGQTKTVWGSSYSTSYIKITAEGRGITATQNGSNPQQWTNQSEIITYQPGTFTLTITAVAEPPTLYLNESYSVPNFVDPEPKLLAVRNNNTNSIDDLLFSDSSYNLITPIDKETITSGYQYLFTFKENDNVSKIWTNRRDTGADHRSNLYYENIDFTGSSQSSLTFEYKTYNNIKYDIAPILDGYKSMIINWLY